MSYSVKGKSISLTRGDTFYCKLTIYEPDGETEYVPQPGDKIRFAIKKNVTDKGEPLLIKVIPNDTMILKIEPEETKELAFGNYVYDLELTKANGDVDTFITKSAFTITEEVY